MVNTRSWTSLHLQKKKNYEKKIRHTWTVLRISIYDYHIEKYVRENVCNKTREKADQRLKYIVLTKRMNWEKYRQYRWWWWARKMIFHIWFMGVFFFLTPPKENPSVSILCKRYAAAPVHLLKVYNFFLSTLFTIMFFFFCKDKSQVGMVRCACARFFLLINICAWFSAVAAAA